MLDVLKEKKKQGNGALSELTLRYISNIIKPKWKENHTNQTDMKIITHHITPLFLTKKKKCLETERVC